MQTLELKDSALVGGGALPVHWATAMGFEDGWYASASSESGNAWTWTGPFASEESAIMAAEDEAGE
jgi:hypothetical protein